MRTGAVSRDRNENEEKRMEGNRMKGKKERRAGEVIRKGKRRAKTEERRRNSYEHARLPLQVR